MAKQIFLLLLPMLKAVVLLNIFVENLIKGFDPLQMLTTVHTHTQAYICKDFFLRLESLRYISNRMFWKT